MTTMSKDATADTEKLLNRADVFVSRLDRCERVSWLKKQGVPDIQILDALLDPEDPELDMFTRDLAQGIASDVANGSLQRAPAWLR